MRRIAVIILVLICLAGLTVPVLAESTLSSLSSDSVVHSDGSCTVVISGELMLEEANDTLSFSIPAGAEDITLNGEKASAVNGVSLQPVTGGRTGQFHFTIRYTLPAVVQTDEEGMFLELALLSGFPYPVEQLQFSLSLPGELAAEPVFTSGYFQEGILSQMTLSVNGSTVTGSTGRLKDHESLQVRIPVDETLFPHHAEPERKLSRTDLLIIVTVILAAAYFLITMAPRPVRRTSRATAPDGISAGDLTLWMAGRGIDLSLLVVSWAQLGYIRIQVDDTGRVLLHKRMSMGNERSSFENRCFKLLFGRRRIVDGTGYHYATLCRSLRGKTPRIKEIYRRRTGNPKIFRILCTAAGVLSGITMAMGFSATSIFLRVLLGIVTGVFSLMLQTGGSRIPLRQKQPLYFSLICAAVWLLLGGLASESLTACLMVAFQFLAGLGIAHGGKRTELGQQAREQIFALRRHMHRVSKKELQQILKQNPGYFHQLAPYALAMDADRAFARRFARLRLVECTYLVSGMRGQMTAAEWAKLLRTTVDTLDQKANRLPLERITGR